MKPVSIANSGTELKDCRDKWFFDERYQCWCLEDVLYTQKADVPAFQRLSVFVPRAYMKADGTPTEESRRIPIVFENNAAGYMQMPHTWLGGPRCYAEQYLQHGLIYITCGCRGRESRNNRGEAVGKSPTTLIDLKTALRFLRHNKAYLPGDFDRIISVGWSAGGAMSTLLGVTGDHPDYAPYLEKNGAFMDESDGVFASQIYCPIIDLEHADMAYEWCFLSDHTSEETQFGPAETMTPFKEALSERLAEEYMAYVNGLHLRHPLDGSPLTLEGLRKGSFYEYLMGCLNDSALRYFEHLSSGNRTVPFTAADYLSGHYTYLAPAPRKGNHHAGQEIALPESGRMMSLGEMMLRPPEGESKPESKPPMETRQGTDKRAWLSWDGRRATVKDLDSYVLSHRRRMKPCTAFDALGCDSGENHVFGSPKQDYMHFNPAIGKAIQALSSRYPQEAEHYQGAFDACEDPALRERVRLINPMNYINENRQGRQAQHYRIRVGAGDADTSFTVSMILAVKLANAGYPVDYALVWDQPHSEADYPGEVLYWIDRICPPSIR